MHGRLFFILLLDKVLQISYTYGWGDALEKIGNGLSWQFNILRSEDLARSDTNERIIYPTAETHLRGKPYQRPFQTAILKTGISDRGVLDPVFGDSLWMA